MFFTDNNNKNTWSIASFTLYRPNHGILTTMMKSTGNTGSRYKKSQGKVEKVLERTYRKEAVT